MSVNRIDSDSIESEEPEIKNPIEITQDSGIFEGQKFLRRFFVYDTEDEETQPVNNQSVGPQQQEAQEQPLSSSDQTQPQPQQDAQEGQLSQEAREQPVGSEDQPQQQQEAQAAQEQPADLADPTEQQQEAQEAREAEEQPVSQSDQPQPQPEIPSRLTGFKRTNLFSSVTVNLVDERLGPAEDVVIRVKSELAGYYEWMSELQVYLIPNLKHKNILELYGCDSDEKSFIPKIRRVLWELKRTQNGSAQQEIDEDPNYVDESEEEIELSLTKPVQIQYWLLNRFQNCVILRDFLKDFTLTWKQMLRISLGIIEGLDYLHDNSVNFLRKTKAKAVTGFIRSTKGAIKKARFEDTFWRMHMKPPFQLMILHRNLSSLNIVLRIETLVQMTRRRQQVNMNQPTTSRQAVAADAAVAQAEAAAAAGEPEMILQPKIWNFSHSSVTHPFQMQHYEQRVPNKMRKDLLNSQYTAPEVLRGHSESLTPQAVKSIDLYACAFIFWELISRCQLPKLFPATAIEQSLREIPGPYLEPFESEFSKHPERPIPDELLDDAVITKKARPIIKPIWTIGLKSNFYCSIIQDLWEDNWEARLHAGTAIYRIKRLIKMNLFRDRRNKYVAKGRRSETYDYEKSWPPSPKSHQAPVHTKNLSCLEFESSGTSTIEGTERAPGQEASDSTRLSANSFYMFND